MSLCLATRRLVRQFLIKLVMKTTLVFVIAYMREKKGQWTDSYWGKLLIRAELKIYQMTATLELVFSALSEKVTDEVAPLEPALSSHTASLFLSPLKSTPSLLQWRARAASLWRVVTQAVIGLVPSAQIHSILSLSQSLWLMCVSSFPGQMPVNVSPLSLHLWIIQLSVPFLMTARIIFLFKSEIGYLRCACVYLELLLCSSNRLSLCF